MRRYPEFCKKNTCNLYDEGHTICKAGYHPPAVTMDKAIRQVLHGGEFPCSKHPERSKVSKWLNSIGHHVIIKPYATQWVSKLHFRIKEDNHEQV